MNHIKHEVLTVKYLREFYSWGFLRQPFARKESFSKDGTDCFSSAREQITITGSKFLDGWVAKEIIFTSRALAYNDFGGTGWNIFAPWYIISIFEKVIRGVRFRTIISCHRIQSTR